MTLLSIISLLLLALLIAVCIFFFSGILVAVGIFLLFFILIAKLMVVPYFSNREKSRLDENHILITPQKTVVRVDTNQILNGFNPYVIDCYYTSKETNREYIFTSSPFMTDPTPLIAGKTIGVFVNPTDYSNYYVDISSIDN